MLSLASSGPTARRQTRRMFIALVAICFPTVTCGPALKRDLSAMPAGQVGFDDLCGLQGYFDTLEMKKATAPKVVSSAQIENETTRGGRSRFAFETDFQLATVRRVLNENWRRLPEGIDAAKRIDLEVQWSDKGGLRRVVTTDDASIYVGEGPVSSALPYHVCLSELLFGAPIYRQRRDVLGLAPLPLPQSMVLKESADAGATDAGAPSDGSVAAPTNVRSDGGLPPAPARPAR